MKISIIVIWNQKNTKDLERCISSIESQVCKEYEVFIVDNSDKSRKEIIKNYLKNEKITYHNFANKSKVCILKSIYKLTKGDYIQYIDDYDYIPIDWLYSVEKECQLGKDLIIGNQVYLDENKKKFQFNLSPAVHLDNAMEKKEFIRLFFLHGGEDRYLTKINNKVISKKVMGEVIENLTIEDDNDFFIDEYINYKCIASAKKIGFFSGSDYVYALKKEVPIYSSTINIVLESFNKFINMLCSDSVFSDNKDWYKDWYREIGIRLYLYHSLQYEEIFLKISELIDADIKPKHNTSYFESLKTYLGDSYEYHNQIKEFIASERCKWVGFDIFDTLIQRPFLEPTDLFYLLNDKFNELIGKRTSIDFSLIRRNGEMGCRSYFISVRPSNEDVTLMEIYDYISEKYDISKEITNKLYEYEILLEQKYCMARAIGKELYQWATYCRKKIIIVSDMYLAQSVIEKILHNNGYYNYEKIFISNEIGISKYSGRLFKYVLDDLKIADSSEMCFIGDNYEVDVKNATKCGMIPFHVPKAVELFCGLNGGIYAGDFYKKIYEPNGGIIDQGTALKFIGIRCMMAVVANKFYGNPFVSINIESDFNADARFIGYYCAGMFLYAEALWLLNDSEQKGINTIHFVSRDGYWVKEAYDKISTIWRKSAKSNYLYFSRKAAASLYLKNKEGIYELFLPPHIMEQTPENIIILLDQVVKKDVDSNNILKQAGIIPYKKFSNLNEFYLFAKVFKEEIYDEKNANDYSKMLYEYFSGIIHENDVIFDVGYSGRMETALSKLLGFTVNSYYFHEHEPWALMRKRNQGFHIDSFYSFKPCSAFVLREQIFTPPKQASCKGFRREKDSIVPVFGNYYAQYKEEYILGIIQNWSIRFIDDMVNIFGEDLKQLVFNKFDACLPFEYYMHYAKEFDRKLMSAIDFEDEFGTNAVISLDEYWNKEKEIYKLENNEKQENEIVKWQTEHNYISEQEIRNIIYMEEGIFQDGIFMKFYRRVNKVFPINSRRRTVIKRIVSLFLK